MRVSVSLSTKVLTRSSLRVRGARAENELSCLEAIHLFVEILDTYFSHVCELDLVWHFHKVCCFTRTQKAPCI